MQSEKMQVVREQLSDNNNSGFMLEGCTDQHLKVYS